MAVIAEVSVMPLAVALGIGLMLGIERERHKGEGPGREAAGLRTFALVTLLGALSLRVGGEVMLAVGAGFVGLSTLLAYRRSQSEDPGLTTEVALLLAFLLGALAQDEPGLAAGLGVAVTILLSSQGRLHALARDTLSEQEIHDGLVLAAAALIVLPLLPDRAVGPGDILNPFTVWRLVVLVMVVSSAAYIALRLIGPRIGLPLAGFAGGFASSTATIATMGAKARKSPDLLRPAVAAGVMSTVATVAFTAIVVTTLNADLLPRLALPLGFAGVAALAYGAAFSLRSARASTTSDERPEKVFELRDAFVIAAAISGLLIVASLLEDALGRSGALVAVAVAGFADAQTSAASAAALAAEGRLAPADAVFGLLAGMTANTVSKAAVALAVGGRRYAVQIWPGLVLVIVAAWCGLIVDRGL